MKPTAMIPHQMGTEILRPIRSAIGAATRAPINVPMESLRASVQGIGSIGTAYHRDDEPSSDITKVIFACLGVELSESLQKVGHCQESRYFAGIVSEASKSEPEYAFCIRNTYTNPPIEIKTPILTDAHVMRRSGE